MDYGKLHALSPPTTRLFSYISCSHQDKNQHLSSHHSSHSLEIPQWTWSQHGEFSPVSGSFYLPSTLLCTRATKEALQLWGCGQFIIKRIFPCSFRNMRMQLLTRVYGTVMRCWGIVVNNIAYQFSPGIRLTQAISPLSMSCSLGGQRKASDSLHNKEITFFFNTSLGR